jgi:pimeloyl-ACP methyl ester carboxylesterase
METVTIKTFTLPTADGLQVPVDHYLYGNRKVVIIAHGFWNSKAAPLLKELAGELKDFYDILIMDFRGHGKSRGLFYWTTKEYLDLLAVMHFACDRYEKVGVIGFSLGGATSLIAAAKEEGMNSLICVSAPTDFARIDYHFWELDVENDIFYNLTGEGRIGKGIRPGPFWLKKEKPIAVAASIQTPVLYLHGEADWVIKPWHSEALYRQTSAKKRLCLIKDGPHAEYLIRKKKEESILVMRQWLEETMGILHKE